uniref:RNA-dependent RNA polymerase n=1 Tax=Conidiobolus non-segmented RNA virus 2-1 TaxID=3233686 RepID=A0AAU7YTA7_9VIRU
MFNTERVLSRHVRAKGEDGRDIVRLWTRDRLSESAADTVRKWRSSVKRELSLVDEDNGMSRSVTLSRLAVLDKWFDQIQDQTISESTLHNLAAMSLAPRNDITSQLPDTFSKEYPRYYASAPPLNVPEVRTARLKDEHGLRRPFLSVSQETGPIPSGPGTAADLVCRLPENVGDRPQSFSAVPPRIYDYIDESADNWLDSFDGNTPTLSWGAFATSRVHLVAHTNKTQYAGNYGIILNAIDHGLPTLKLRELPKPRLGALEDVRINKSAHPGFYSRRFAKNKYDRIDVQRDIARDLFSRTARKPHADTSLWMCGAREKRNDVDNGDPIKSRLILMPETAPALVSSMYSQPVGDLIAHHESPIHIGTKSGRNAHESFCKLFDPCEYTIAADWKSFDSCVSEHLIVGAFMIIRSMFPDGDDVDNHFLYFMSSMVFKNVVTPGGYVYRIRRGLPSGSPWTSVIGSLVNWLVLYTTLSGLMNPHDANQIPLALCGDDMLIGLPTVSETYPHGATAPTTSEIFRRAKWLWGFESKSSQQHDGFFSSCWPERCMPFLGTRYRWGQFPCKSDLELMPLWALPTKRPGPLEYEMYLFKFMEHTPPFNTGLASRRYDYCRWATIKGKGIKSLPHDVKYLDTILPKAFVFYMSTYAEGGISDAATWSRARVVRLDPIKHGGYQYTDGIKRKRYSRIHAAHHSILHSAQPIPRGYYSPVRTSINQSLRRPNHAAGVYDTILQVRQFVSNVVSRLTGTDVNHARPPPQPD